MKPQNGSTSVFWNMLLHWILEVLEKWIHFIIYDKISRTLRSWDTEGVSNIIYRFPISWPRQLLNPEEELREVAQGSVRWLPGDLGTLNQEANMDPQTLPSPWIIYDDLAAALRPSHESGPCMQTHNKQTRLQIPLVYQLGCLKINFPGKTEFILKTVSVNFSSSCWKCCSSGKCRSQRDTWVMGWGGMGLSWPHTESKLPGRAPNIKHGNFFLSGIMSWTTAQIDEGALWLRGGHGWGGSWLRREPWLRESRGWGGVMTERDL